MLLHALMVLLEPVFAAVEALPSFDPEAVAMPTIIRQAIGAANLLFPLEPVFTVLGVLVPAYALFLTYKVVVFIYNLLPWLR